MDATSKFHFCTIVTILKKYIQVENIFHEEERKYYDIERLWGDGKICNPATGRCVKKTGKAGIKALKEWDDLDFQTLRNDLKMTVAVRVDSELL